MSIITIHSTNPDLSFILAKNPATQAAAAKPFERDLRLGRVYGWFSNAQGTEFRLWFKDSPSETSFGNRTEFEHLDISRYCHPYLPVAVFSKLLETACNTQHEKDTEDYITVVRFHMQCRASLMARFEKLQGCEVYSDLVSPGTYHVTAIAQGVQKALNFVIAMCVVATMSDDDFYLPLDKSAVAKYLKVLNRCEAPYYLRHLFVSRAITSTGMFDSMAELLKSDVYKLQYGNTQVQRAAGIQEALGLVGGGKGGTLVDIGCGELYHALRMIKEYSQILGFESDEMAFQKATRKIKNKGIENITVSAAEVTAQYVCENETLFSDVDVLMTEVLEHRSKEESGKLLSTLAQVNTGTIIITVPNKSFNAHYGIGSDEFRHLDHKWEPTKEEFIFFIRDSLMAVKSDRNVAVRGIGDSVIEPDGSEEHTTLMAVIFPPVVSPTLVDGLPNPAGLPDSAPISF